MRTVDPIGELVHDHAGINRRVLELGKLVAGRREGSLPRELHELREELFLHFAREEEGLFPFVTGRYPDLAERVHAMVTAHDTICGVVARMCQLVTTDANADVAPMFARFETVYADHADLEADVLARLRDRLDAADRAHLAELVRGL